LNTETSLMKTIIYYSIDRNELSLKQLKNNNFKIIIGINNFRKINYNFRESIMIKDLIWTCLMIVSNKRKKYFMIVLCIIIVN